MGKEVKDDDLGLKIVRPVQNPSIDIVAVHGIGAHPDRTWTMEKGEGEWVNWLTDPAMLPQKLPDACIMRFGYKSEWFGSEKVETKKTLVQDVAKALLKGLEHCRDDPTRPLLFIAHSFGGHVVMYALRHSFENPDEWLNPFASTAGLVFLGTPFRGRQGMQLSDMIRRIKEAHPDYQIWQETMDMSVPDNPFLLETVHRFLETRVDKRFIPICCFYETLPSPLGKVLQSSDPVKAAGKDYLVPEGSACLDYSIGIHRHPLDRHHYNLNKFCQDSDQNYKSVEDCIRKMASEAMNFLKECSNAQTVYKTDFSLAGVPVVETFIDRPLEMKALENTLLAKRDSRRKVFALHGLGGIGKTQLSAEFARRFHHHFSSVFWLDGATEDNLIRSLVACAGRISTGQISEEANKLLREHGDDKAVAKEVKRWLSQTLNSDWLVIVDNFDKEYKPNSIKHFITEYISEADHGSILFTTRLRSVSDLGHSLELGKVDKRQAQEILESLLKSEHDLIECDEILNRLDGLPLAIAQAGAFIKESGTSFEDYIEFYDREFKMLMDRIDSDEFRSGEFQNDELRSDEFREYHGSVWTTWIISFNEIRNKGATGMTAANLLILWSCLSNKDLFHELFPQRDRKLQACFPRWMNDLASSRLKFTRVMQLLGRYSMIEPIGEEGRYSTHPVVHKWVYHYFYDTVLKTMSRIAIVLMGNVYGVLSDYGRLAYRIVPHIESCRHRMLLDEDSINAHDSRYNGELEHGKVLEHDNALELAYQSAKKVLFNNKNPQLLIMMDRICEDEEQILRSLEDKPVFNHPSMVEAILSVGRVYLERNRLEDATRMGEWGLERLRVSRDSESRLLAMIFLGRLYSYQKKISDARRILQSALLECKSAQSSNGQLDIQLVADLVFVSTALFLETDQYDKATSIMELTHTGRSIQLPDDEDSGSVAGLKLLALHGLGILYLITGERIEVRNLHGIVTKYSEDENNVLRSKAISSLWQQIDMQWSDVDKKMLVDAQDAYQKARQASVGDNLGNGLAKHFLTCCWNMTHSPKERDLMLGIVVMRMIESVRGVV